MSIDELYKLRNGLWSLKDCEILDEATDLVSILIDYDFLGTDFAITTHTDEYNVYCKKP